MDNKKPKPWRKQPKTYSDYCAENPDQVEGSAMAKRVTGFGIPLGKSPKKSEARSDWFNNKHRKSYGKKDSKQTG